MPETHETSISQLINKIKEGIIRIPNFQRSFVWEPVHVQNFIDSIYKGYPVGTVLIWRTDCDIKDKNKIGNHILPERELGDRYSYILDGQQRLTSLFKVFTSDDDPDNPDTYKIYYNLTQEEDIQGAQFCAMAIDEADPDNYFDLTCIFDSVSYRRATDSLSDDKKEKVDSMQQIFRDAKIPVTRIEETDTTKVAIIFERINRLGVPLDTYDLLSAWTWSEEFLLFDKYDDICEEIGSKGFGDLTEDRDLLLYCCTGVINGVASKRAIMDLIGSQVRERFEEIIIGLRGAIDFVNNNCFVYSLNIMPYPKMLVPLTVFFSTDREEGYNPTPKQNEKLKQWFWRSCFTKRYSHATDRIQSQDIKHMIELKNNEEYNIDIYSNSSHAELCICSSFTMRSYNTKTFITMLASASPVTFLSNNPIILNKALVACNSSEFHHIYPKSYLRDIDIIKDMINILPNIAFISRSENQLISDRSPMDYVCEIKNKEMLQTRALLPIDFDTMDYESFIKMRTKKLVDYACSLMSIDPAPLSIYNSTISWTNN